MVIHSTMAILVGYSPFGRSAERLGLSTNDFCSNWGSDEKEEIVF